MTPTEALADTVRGEWGRLIALLLAQFRRLDLAEDGLAEAIEAAARRWPTDGTPDRPAAWLLTTARRRVLDRLRAEAMAVRRAPLLLVEADRSAALGPRADDGDLVDDDLLRLVLMCAHPALSPESASALSLRLVLGVSTADIARLFLVSEPTMAARITRAKRKITTAGIPFGIPGASELPARLRTVAQTAYLAFTAGYAAASGPDLVRVELAGEAIRLVRVTLALRDDPALRALLALMLLQHSRRDARTEAGALVLLPDQDRSRWRHSEIDEGLAVLAALPPLDERTAEAYRLQALVAAEHARAPRATETRWDRIAATYAALKSLTPGPIVRMARAVAVAEADGPRAGLALLEGARRPRPGQPSPAGDPCRAADPSRRRRCGRRGIRAGDQVVPQRGRAGSPHGAAVSARSGARQACLRLSRPCVCRRERR